MNIQNETTPHFATTSPPFDLAPDEEQSLVCEMVSRFASRQLTDTSLESENIRKEFEQLGLDELLSDFSDPVLITLISEKLGYGCALESLRLLLPQVLFSTHQTEPSANLCIAQSAATGIGVTGLISEPDRALVPLLICRDSICSFALHDLSDLVLPPARCEMRGFSVLKGTLPFGLYSQVAEPAANSPFAATRLALVLTSLLIGGIGRALDFGFDYAQTREAFGKAIIGHQPVSFRLVEGLMKLESLRLLLWREATRYPHCQDLKGLVEETLYASATVLRDVMQNCGGHGYVASTEINVLFQTNALCRALLSDLSNSFLEFPSLEEKTC